MIKKIFGTDANDKALLVDKKKTKIIRAKDGCFNHFFDKETGLSMTWGKNKEDDPTYSPYGPLIADIEITDICFGPGGKVCDFCYKSNTPKGTYMTFETFKRLFEKLGTLTNIEIETEVGIIYFKPYDDVKTKNGMKKAKDLTIDDELA